MFNQFPLDQSQYQILHDIGNSSDATVVLARCIPNNKLVAIKQIDLEICNVTFHQLANEIKFWALMHHPNAISYHGSFMVQAKLWLIMDFIDGGSLLDILKDYYQTGIKDETIIATILKQILVFLDYFHSHQQLHRDIQTKNILITMSGEVKVSGFWNAATLITAGKRIDARSSLLTISSYVAPEALIAADGKDRKYQFPADIWSLGIVAYELATGTVPHSGLSPIELMKVITQSPPPTLPRSFSTQFRDFISQCLDTQPDKRATAHKLLKHKFMDQAKDSTFLASVLMSQLPPLIRRFEIKEQQKEEKAEKNVKLAKQILFDLPSDDDDNNSSQQQHSTHDQASKDQENVAEIPPPTATLKSKKIKITVEKSTFKLDDPK